MLDNLLPAQPDVLFTKTGAPQTFSLDGEAFLHLDTSTWRREAHLNPADLKVGDRVSVLARPSNPQLHARVRGLLDGLQIQFFTVSQLAPLTLSYEVGEAALKVPIRNDDGKVVGTMSFGTHAEEDKMRAMSASAVPYYAPEQPANRMVVVLDNTQHLEFERYMAATLAEVAADFAAHKVVLEPTFQVREVATLVNGKVIPEKTIIWVQRLIATQAR